MVRDAVRQVGVSFTENRDPVISGVVKAPWGLLKRRQPSEGGQPGRVPLTGALGVVPVPWASLQGLRPKLVIDPGLVYTKAMKVKMAKKSSPLQQLGTQACSQSGRGQAEGSAHQD